MTNFKCTITHPFTHENCKLQLEDPNIFITFSKKTKCLNNIDLYSQLTINNALERPVSMTQLSNEIFGGEEEFYSKLDSLKIPINKLDIDESNDNDDSYLDFKQFEDKFDKSTLFPIDDPELTKLDISHLTTDEQEKVNTLINKFPSAFAKHLQDHGKYKLFKVSLTFIEGETAIQAKRQMDYDKVHKEISDLEESGIITENKSTKLSNLCNLVIIQKLERLSKADKSVISEEKRKN